MTRVTATCLTLFLLVVSTSCNNLFIGVHDPMESMIYNKVHQENPDKWVGSETVTVNSFDNGVINAINVKDLRSDKLGEAHIRDGGIGQKFVSIELVSPSKLQGYNFAVKVYAVDSDDYIGKAKERN